VNSQEAGLVKVNGKLADKIESGDFIVTAEHLPKAAANGSATIAAMSALGDGPVAVNVADNQSGVAMSSLAASVAVLGAGRESVYQIITRDRNRVALQSDLIGAASLGVKNVLCLSGYHQTLGGCAESANVYDIDSIQLLDALGRMCSEGVLLDGTKIEGDLAMLAGAAANPFLKPLELNIIRLVKKVAAGASFIQTQAVFDVEAFGLWLDAARQEGISDKAAILAGVLPLDSAAEAEELRETYTDFTIGDEVIERLNAAGDEEAQKKEGLAICVEVIQKIKDMDGLRGIHILSGGKEPVVPEVLAASRL
jgi:methylenetetrahydrofolate reductase (NADPH)